MRGLRSARFRSILVCSAGLLLLAGCAASSPGSTTPPTDGPTLEAAEPDLAVGASEFGPIVVDGAGMTVYFFDNDAPGSGESACVAACAATWPAVHPAGEEPVVEGVSAEVGTITGTDGELQLTLDGRPVYTFANDAAPGDVSGQGVNDVWYVVGPDGAELTGPPESGDYSY